MKNKKMFRDWFVLFFTIVSLTAGILLTDKSAEGGCITKCNQHIEVAGIGDKKCCGTQSNHAVALGTEGICIVSLNVLQDIDLSTLLPDDDCDSNENNQTCQTKFCPTTGFGLSAGSFCQVRYSSTGNTDATCEANVSMLGGTWDNTRFECIECSGANNKGYVWGTSTSIAYATPSLVFKEACGAVAACDEKNTGDACGTGGTCDATGQCVLVTHTECSGDWCVEVAGAGVDACSDHDECGGCVCSDGTTCDNCSAVNVGKYCNSSGELENDCTSCGCPAGTTCDANSDICEDNSCPSTDNSIFNLKFDKDSYDLGNTVTLYGTYKFAAFELCIYAPDGDNEDGFFVATDMGDVEMTADIAGEWKGYYDSVGSCSNSSSCFVSVFVNAPPPPPVCGTADTICPIGCTNPPDPDCPAAGPACTVTEAPEATCDDGIDNDCDGFVDCADLNCVGDPSCVGGGCDNDNIKEAGEQCDGTDLDGNDCTTFGFTGGTLSCTGSCTFDTSACTGGASTGIPCGLGTGELCNPLTGWSTIPDIAEGMLDYLLGLVGSVALLFLIIAGVMYMTAAGNEERITSAKKILTGALIGLAIVLLAYSLLVEIRNILGVI